MRIAVDRCGTSMRHMPLILCVLSLLIRQGLGQTEKDWLDPERFEKILAEADAACVELIKYDKSREKSLFTFSSVETLGRVADTYLRRGQVKQARTVLELNFDPVTAAFLIDTGAVKFGSPVPTRTKFSNVTEEYSWKLSILVSLAHGQRFDEAVEMLGRFPAEKQTPAIRIRYLEIIAKKCIEVGNEAKCREISSRIWRQMKLLKPEDPLRILQSVKLLQHAMKFSKMDSTKSLVSALNALMNDSAAVATLNPEQHLDVLLELGKANLRIGQIDQAGRHLDAARAQLAMIDDEFFDRQTESSHLELAFADLSAEQGLAEKSKVHAQLAFNHLTMIDESKTRTQAKALDGGQGFFSAVFSVSSGSGFVDLILWHEENGNQQQAVKIWKQMPLSYQKLKCQIDIAKRRVKSSKTDSAVQCANLLLDSIDDQTTIGSQLSIKIAAAHIFQECNRSRERDQVLNELLTDSQILDSDQLKQTLASELAELELYKRAYLLTQKIETVALRAGPLSRIALKGSAPLK